ncbi:unnamed protein product [Cylindrotheca closterium]|uniref:RING-type domain-containing protein n=1 Tax=Cylindrotheca closterium TaxID=2856 RepID=A0AAD2CND7_9STRA|nr:unnamed protein product [Cylindrotheca closterium]
MSFGDCPICLEEFKEADVLFKLPCYTCGYNFCVNCLDDFVKSSKDDFQEASDGSRQVKVQLNCPQCRSKYPMDILEIGVLRNAHILAASLVHNSTGQRLEDSDLSATQLAKKRDFQRYGQNKSIQGAFGLYKKVMHDGNLDLPEMLKVERLPAFDVYGQSNDGETGEASQDNNRAAETIDESLFQGLGESMGKDEKLFLTQLLTSGKAEKLAQAAMIMNGILKLSMSGHTMAANNSSDPNAHIKIAERIAKVKKQFPAANHMPGYFMIPPFDSSQKHLLLEDGQWNGKIVPPAQSKRVFDAIYEKNYRPKPSSRPVVLVKGVRGPVGRLGLRRGDAVTHVNDMEWNGSAAELKEYLRQSFAKHTSDEISMTVNANEETAEFLKVRSDMLSRSNILR